MDSSPRRDAAQEPGTPRDPPRESSDDKSLIDHELEKARKAALEANECFLDLQRRSLEKATPPAPAPRPAPAVPPRHLIRSIVLHHHRRRIKGGLRRLHLPPRRGEESMLRLEKREK